jgi:quercetin dioxygenase-like cupin family protein
MGEAVSAIIEQTEMRQQLAALERAITAYLPPVEMKVVHHFSKGVYARELHIPKGTVLTGHIHKHQNLNIMSKGDMTVLTEDGPVRVQAPFTIVSPAGTKRAAYAHEDTIWTTVHGTDLTDVDEIEAAFICHDFDQYQLHVAETLKLERSTLCHGEQ